MKKSEIKEYVFKALDSLLIPKGYYSVKIGLDPTYVLKKNNIIISFFLNFKDLGEISFSKFEISLKCIEDIIFEIKIPQNNFDYIDNKKYFLISIIDEITLMPKEYYRGIGYYVGTHEQLEFFTNWIINYLEKDGKAFIEKYCYLPNILQEMDQLDSESLTWNNRDRGILSGTLDAYFRGLIISKLCNDSNFSKKMEKMDAKFKQPGYEAWIPYYEKLKERLRTIEPIYNI